jgi:uncharacterized protein (TIGR03382 family)
VTGNCTPLTSVSCTALNTCHRVGICNPATGLCSNPQKADGAVCENDGDRCTIGETCLAGSCTASTEVVVCTPLSQCHSAGICDSSTGACSNPVLPSGTVCDDGDMCTSGETCDAGNCGAPTDNVTCPDSDECQDNISCRPASGQCEGVPKTDGTLCSEGACESGVCVPASMDPPDGGGSAKAKSGGCNSTSPGAWPLLVVALALVSRRRGRYLRQLY